MVGETISTDVSNFFRHLEQLKQIFTETKECLDEVDYDEHFDAELYKSSSLPEVEESDLQRSFAKSPCFVLLGESNSSKASIVNDLLTLPRLLPSGCDDNFGDVDRWRTIFVHCGSETRCSLISRNDRLNRETPVPLNDDQFESSIPRRFLLLNYQESEYKDAVLDVQLANSALRNCCLVLPSYDSPSSFLDVVLEWRRKSVVILIYVVTGVILNELDFDRLAALRRAAPDMAIFFVKSQCSIRLFDLPESDRYVGFESKREIEGTSPANQTNGNVLRQQLTELGYLTSSDQQQVRSRSVCDEFERVFKTATCLKSDLIENGTDLAKLVYFVRQILRSFLVGAACRVNEWHDSLMRMFILTAFDMARDQIITPKRIVYARSKGAQLYADLMQSTAQKQREMEKLISTTINDEKSTIIENAEGYFDQNESETVDGRRRLNSVEEIQRFVLTKLSDDVADRLTNSLDCLKQTFVGTLERCLESLEQSFDGDDENTAAGRALKQMITAAYNSDLTWPTCTPLVRLLWEKMKQVTFDAAALFMPCGTFSYEALSTSNHVLCATDADEETMMRRRKCVAVETLSKLSEAKLAKVLCAQIRTRIGAAHEAFQTSLNRIEEFHTGRLQKAEEQRLTLRKSHAPRLARLAMESLALRDSLLYGMPKLGIEIGRGQYGVVYDCETWGRFGACAVKSVVPPDDKHWNDLALEFHYTKSLVEHERIVKLHGAVVDHNYGGGSYSGGLPAVLLIMERMRRDLHTAIRAGLKFELRLRVAIDVVEGLRFLHSQGLVHRDIKLKNVLLDERDRAKITDLGFCKPEAMMSGSVVGTPIHMAPELFSRNYDSSVDVYAFGVLFWYICAGHVRLPQTFEQCINKDQLWSSVKQGVRPEQLSCFDAECWDIMKTCWSGEPGQRPHLGDLQPKLERLLTEYIESNQNK